MNARWVAASMMALTGMSSAGIASLSNDDQSATTLRVSQSRDMVVGQRKPSVRRVVIRNQLILKVPIQPRQTRATGFRVIDAPRCLSTREISGAALTGPRAIDFILEQGRRMRVQMDKDCKSLDFYGGFYLQPTDDEVCAGRDVIRTRMGGNCQIQRFQLLQPIGD